MESSEEGYSSQEVELGPSSPLQTEVVGAGLAWATQRGDKNRIRRARIP